MISLRKAPLCLLVALCIGCGEQDDHNTSTSAAALTAQRVASPQPASPHIPILDAIARRDLAALAPLLAPYHSAPGAILHVEQGPIDGYQGSPEPVIVRHRSAPEVSLLVSGDAPVEVALLDLHGRLIPLPASLEPVEDVDGLLRLRIAQRDLPTQGLLLAGPAGVDLAALPAGTLALAVVDDRWGCADMQTSCAAGDYACLVEHQQRCVELDLEFLARHPLADATDEGERLVQYVNLHSHIKHAVVSDAPVASDARGDWHALSFDAPAGVTLQRVALIDDASDLPTPLAWRQVRGAYQLLAPAGGLPVGLIVLDTAPRAARFEDIGVAHTPAALNAPKACRTWQLSGCVKVEDTESQSGLINQPVAGALIRPATATKLGLNIFLPWAPTVTDANGCFNTSATFCGISALLKRKHRAKLSLMGPKLVVRNPLAVESVLDQGFFKIFQDNTLRAHGSLSAGTLIFKPGASGELGEQRRQRQALSWWTARKLDASFQAQHGWFGFHAPYAIAYPHPLIGGVALPINPPTILLRDSDWSFDTLIHEIGHVWHYMHKWGVMPNIVTSLLNGLSTHNCQEDLNIGFLEGFAEFFARQTLCGAVFQSPSCYTTTPYGEDGLRNQYACNDEIGQGLLSPYMVTRNDDGVTHALQALVVDDFYLRRFNNAYFFQPFYSSNQLDKNCQYYPFNNLSFWHVLHAFEAKPSLGYTTHFPITITHGISEFYDRFRAIHNLPYGFIQDRKQTWNVHWGIDPIQQCRKPCAELSPWWNGANDAALVNGDRCDIEPVPAGQVGFVEQNRYFIKEQAYCPIGSYDTANCHVLSPAPGTQPFIFNNNLYTTPLPGNVCPHGGFDGANCFIAATPAGTQPFIFNGMLYVTPIYQGCAAGIPLGANKCLMGMPPAGATAQIVSNNFSYPRQ